jgi:hypothetical protein
MQRAKIQWIILFVNTLVAGIAQPPSSEKKPIVIKIQPFSVLKNQLSFAMETILKPGVRNTDIEIGYINSKILPNPFVGLRPNFYNSQNHLAQNSGVYLKAGVKFLIGKDFSKAAIKNASTLNGRYVKVDIACSYLNFQDVIRYGSFLNFQSTPFSSSYRDATIITNVNLIAYGAFVNYGRQIVFAKCFVFDYYVGLGYTAQSHSYTNTNFLNSPNNGDHVDYAFEINNYHGFVRSNALSVTSGIRFGYIIR